MKTYLQAFDLREVINADVEPPPLRANPTLAQIRQRAKRYKAMSCLQNRLWPVSLQNKHETDLRRNFNELKEQGSNNS
ncbi:putative LRR receptor-like serine/threonine-protein kinase [Gossypium australe]|uniref:Putative LRR receptor-like serine/threonine-protein kinase n=1 Tax=Gossypium australe TaxID=47621 RepID=A0A5B6WC47_9ROSI|nr:putative LRR receptor-like serine/threonine-protein kinase [Gossypium australe]